jgi:putative IMPACT (imprinted ancient) family translation regulator
VWAFRCSTGEERWDDDGEPAGTGGRPILAAIDSGEVSDVAVVVTRWFGGTKLGTGGLARAYGGAAAAAIEALELNTVRPGRVVRIRYHWPDTGAVAKTLDAFGARRIAVRHEEGAELDVAIPEVEAGALLAALREATGGRVASSVREGQVWVSIEA